MDQKRKEKFLEYLFPFVNAAFVGARPKNELSSWHYWTCHLNWHTTNPFMAKITSTTLSLAKFLLLLSLIIIW